MKFLFLPTAALVLNALCGCSPFNSPDGFPSGLLGSGSDARVYNVQTGQYEWPEREAAPPRSKRKATSLSAALKAVPQATPAPDERIYSTETGRYEWPETTKGVSRTSPFQ